VFTERKNIAVWVKKQGGLGSFYRSQHELVAIFKSGKAKHINNMRLGATGRNRTNVWSYAGNNSFHRGRDDELSLHPTIKPAAFYADAILDCSNRGSIILDPFGGSGTLCLAAERTGRRARLIERDPGYVDVTLYRARKLLGLSAVNLWTGKVLEPLATRPRNAKARGGAR
jgi:DNA modification methylase